MSHILVVEDNKGWQDQIVEILNERSYTLICASTSEEAFRAISKSRIDLAILDINLTDVAGNRDGEKIVEYLKGVQRFLPIIIISGTIPANSASLTSRVYGFFSKQSFDPDEFLSKVDQALQDK